MTREWKPGDVAIVSDGEVEWFGLVRNRSAAARPALEFVYTTGGYDMVNDLADGFTARPLAVIDPEDREQAERLWVTLRDGLALRSRDNLQAALREYANPTPPRPDEPTGLGAVVATESDGYWIRVSAELANPWLNVQTGSQRHWDRVPAVRVLSEGVEVDR